MKKIGLFGGSFNPVHSGHIKIVEYCYKFLNFDEIWIILNNLNPFKEFEKSEKVSWKQRYDMLKIATADLKYVKILDFEKKAKIHYSFETAKSLKHQNPNYTFTWITGQDVIKSLPKWFKFNELIKMVNFISFYRNTQQFLSEVEKKICIQFNIQMLSCDFVDISSSDIRKGKKLNLQLPKINQYINDRALYIYSRLMYASSKNIHRWQHSKAVAAMARNLALFYNYQNPNAAFLAGALHDITKYWSDEQHINLIKPSYPKALFEHPKTYHAVSGSIYVHHFLRIEDKGVIDAIRFHTIGSSKNMGLLQMIIYIADKISLDRQYPGVETFRLLAFKDIQHCFSKLIITQYERHKATLNSNSAVPQIYKYWKNYEKR